MKAKLIFPLLFFTIIVNGQTKGEIDSLLTKISNSNNSKDLINLEETMQLINFGEGSIPLLIEFYNDTTTANVYSDCLNSKLNKGEIALIITDHIISLPYFLLTGVQNCRLSFCENNPNLIEFYINSIRRKPREFIFRFNLWYSLKDQKNSDRKFRNEIEKCQKSKKPCF